jgi:hypothetical protein
VRAAQTNNIRRTVVQLVAVPAGGVTLRLGDNPIGLIPQTARVVSWQISPSPTGAQSVTWVSLNRDLALSLSSVATSQALPLAAGEALTDNAVTPGQTCDVFPLTVICDAAGAVRLVVTYEDVYPGADGDCGCH